MENKLLVTPAPHTARTYTTSIMMFAMLLALLPTAISGIINFGIRALYIILISMVSSYLFELAFKVTKGEKINWLDISSLVTGLIIALILPVTVPLYYI